MKSEIKYYGILLLKRYNATFLLNPFHCLHSCYYCANIKGKCSYSMPLETCLTMAWQKKIRKRWLQSLLLKVVKGIMKNEKGEINGFVQGLK